MVVARLFLGACVWYATFAVAFVPHSAPLRLTIHRHVDDTKQLFVPTSSARSSSQIEQRRRQPFSPRLSARLFGNIELSGLIYDSTSTAFDAWEWTANIGAPAALVAGAVLVTLSETREDSAPRNPTARGRATSSWRCASCSSLRSPLKLYRSLFPQ